MSLTWLLDTNIVSEPFRSRPAPGLLRRLDDASGTCAIGSPTWHQLCFGHALLPESSRKRALDRYLNDVVLPSFPVLPYDRAAAAWHGRERARLRQAGREPPFVDGQLAAIAATRGLVLVTRNVSDFSGFPDLAVENWLDED